MPKLWCKALAGYSNTEIKKGLAKAISQGNGFAPTLPEFLRFCNGIDYDEAFYRCLNQAPEGRVERWVSEQVGYNVRVETHRQAQKIHQRYLDMAIKMERRGELVLPEDLPLVLAEHSAVSLTDKIREEAGLPDPNRFKPGSVMNRIAVMTKTTKEIHNGIYD